MSGRIFEVLHSMYQGVLSVMKESVRGENGFVDVIEHFVGVKQGCILSPCLFSLFIADLPKMLEKYNAKGVKLLDVFIRVLLYADDGALIAASAADLQYMLDVLRIYCFRWKMIVNIDKTVVFFFNHPSAIPRESFIFRYDGHVLSVGDQFKYLGLVFHESGAWAEMIMNRLQAAKFLIAIWRRRFCAWVFNSCIVQRLFTTCVMPALDYGVPLWGVGPYSSAE